MQKGTNLSILNLKIKTRAFTGTCYMYTKKSLVLMEAIQTNQMILSDFKFSGINNNLGIKEKDKER